VDVYLIRHADALCLGERGITDDEERPLSEEGTQQARDVGQLFQRKGIVLDRLYSSPLLRARQTAEAMLHSWSRHDMEMQICPLLAPGAKPRKLSRFLLKQGGENVGMVGHMPHLASIAGWLIGDKGLQIELAKAGVAYIHCEEAPGKGLGVLRWLITPDWFGS
jgi:phosphohistidine phosphatase